MLGAPCRKQLTSYLQSGKGEVSGTTTKEKATFPNSWLLPRVRPWREPRQPGHPGMKLAAQHLPCEVSILSLLIRSWGSDGWWGVWA